ncbi:hypothetical protein RhiirC2_792114 [Rhizophagus irregularis]|uniref:Uncharacterized protein n=1 Tax=Rhizophagus irregularis TaxID=588596 RepID=A0A2N1MHX0_9GLOM|nr:hypothetical protein RhiirC2_792114 [Rhizophagus irregularis]
MDDKIFSFDNDRLREILVDHADPLSNLSLEENEELLAINDIGDYWPEKPPKKNIHVIVEPPVSTSASNKVLELREKLASLQALLNKSVYVTVLTLLHYRLRRRRSPETEAKQVDCKYRTCDSRRA